MQTHKLALIAFTVLSSGVVSTSLMADEAHPLGTDPQSDTRGAMTPGQGMMDIDHMQERMKSMQQLMERIHKTDDPATRRKLMSEHMQEMQKVMIDMRGMMMGPDMMQGGPGGKMGNGKGMPMEDRQKMMEQRLDMMQQMMEQMMGQMMVQQGAMKGDKGKDKSGDEGGK